ncbi:MAG TPA: class I SAM-dependent rRNA methyltransferase [Cytophagales bacterium]|nr:class I SAM-dependent rRNA methyltransferase [Cytophagales bacterium]
MAYKILKLKPGREKSLINRHPWVFSGALQAVPNARNGEIVRVESHKNEFLGYGFFSKNSQISCRVFEFREPDLDFTQNPSYWHDKISKAFALRKDLVITPKTNTFRLIHAEGDFLPGLIVDVYNETAVVLVLVKGIEHLLEYIISGLKTLGIKDIYLRNTANNKNVENISVESGWRGEAGSEELFVIENGIKFKVNIAEGQKTGFFIDQRDNRQLLKSLVTNKKVLNTFSYTGGFSAYALAGGATEVHSVDISAEAIKVCEENISLNLAQANHKGITADCFDYLRQMQEKYDVIVLDPPAFAKNAHAVNQAAKGYKDINLQAIKKINEGGLIFTFSCSQHIDKDLFRKIVFGAAADAGREVRIIHQLTQPADHPINIYHPEGEYLKGLVLKVD